SIQLDECRDQGSKETPSPVGLGNPGKPATAQPGNEPRTNQTAGTPGCGPQPELCVLQLARVCPRESTLRPRADHPRIQKDMCQTRKEIQAKAPKRPYKNFADFCYRFSPNFSVTGEYRCSNCYGKRWVY